MGDEYRVGLYETLAEYTSLNPKKLVIFAVVSIILCDLACAVSTDFVLHGRLSFSFHGNSFSWYFYNETGDCVVMAVARVVILPLIAYLAFKGGEILSQDNSHVSSVPYISCSCFKCFYQGKYSLLSVHVEETTRKTFDSHGEIGQPLLGSCDNKGPEETASGVASDEVFKAEDELARAAEAAVRQENELSIAKSRANTRQNMWLAVLFTLSVASQVYVGLKCISFNYPSEHRKKSQLGALMGLGVLWANCLSWALREVVSKGHAQDGVKVSTLHPHRLHMHNTMAGHWCDICSTQIKDGKAYRCKLCDFDMCLRCFAKKDKLTMEGVLRGDKGVRQENDMNIKEYFRRAMAIAGTEWKLFTVAMFSLFCYNLLSLTLPKLQGAILDAVVNNKGPKFDRNVELYMLVSVGVGFLGGIQSLCFSVVGRKIAKTIRLCLFNGIVIQDVAFFDGNSSGQLSSRLTSDVSFMVQPIQSMMGSLLSNSMLLVGGIGMCFVTSWQLSMLAFTTIGPIVHVTQVYARWSSHLNRQIFAALASANGCAVEALSNIRTVKAFSTEDMEIEKYSSGILIALQKGIYDALGGAGMYTINSYLDLGAGVLILWYGGRLAMQEDSTLSPGKLITFQLYWNMINGAYKGLVDILTNLTRSAGAASRIFSLMDSLPDIDIRKGIPVDKSEINGALELRSVDFAYQMRPDHQVLKDLSLTIPAGSTCALVGRSGGGKSTIVNLILRFYDPQAGEVLLDGRNLSDLRLKDVRQQIGLVAQNTELFAGSVEDNISYGMMPGTYTRADIIAAAKKACAHDFITEMSEGYGTRVGERGVRLSGGQKQRIAIARVFLRKPRILLLDEATSSLDAESEAKVQEAIDRLIEEGGATVVLVAHRLSTVVNANQIAVVGNGQIIEVGNHQSLLAKDGAYAALVKRQLAKINSVVDMDAVGDSEDSGYSGEVEGKG